MLLCIASFLTSCITTVTEPLDLAFEEKLVVRGVVRSGDALDSVAMSITKSLPALAEPTTSQLQVSGITGTISIQSPNSAQTQTFSLRQQTPLLYGIANNSSSTSIRAASGTLLTLNLTRKLPNGTEQRASAETRIPPQPVIREVRIVPQPTLVVTTATPIPGATPTTSVRTDTLFAAEVRFDALPRIAYRIAIQGVDSLGNAQGGQELTKELTQVFEGGVLFHTDASVQERTVTSPSLPRQTQVFLRSSAFRYKITVYAFDEAYYPYFLTRGRGQQASSLFGGTNENITWNVQGDAIGMFISVAERTVWVRK
jgi:hypothetical protein